MNVRICRWITAAVAALGIINILPVPKTVFAGETREAEQQIGKAIVNLAIATQERKGGWRLSAKDSESNLWLRWTDSAGVPYSTRITFYDFPNGTFGAQAVIGIKSNAMGFLPSIIPLAAIQKKLPFEGTVEIVPSPPRPYERTYTLLDASGAPTQTLEIAPVGKNGQQLAIVAGTLHLVFPRGDPASGIDALMDVAGTRLVLRPGIAVNAKKLTKGTLVVEILLKDIVEKDPAGNEKTVKNAAYYKVTAEAGEPPEIIDLPETTPSANPNKSSSSQPVAPTAEQDLRTPKTSDATTGTASEAQNLGFTSKFSKWGVSFEYPKTWNEHSAAQVAAMKSAVVAQLDAEPGNMKTRKLREFGMIVTPNEEAALLIMMYSLARPMGVQELITERDAVYRDAQKTGDVTKVNHLKQTVVAQLPAIDEDVERSNGGRGRTVKVVRTSEILELSLIVHDGRNFDQFLPAYEQVLHSLSFDEQAR